MDRSTATFVDGLGAAAATSGILNQLQGRMRRTRVAGSRKDHYFKPHPRARVWEEERHRDLPAWSVRRFYRLLIPPIAFLCARGSRRGRTPPAPPGSRT